MEFSLTWKIPSVSVNLGYTQSYYFKKCKIHFKLSKKLRFATLWVSAFAVNFQVSKRPENDCHDQQTIYVSKAEVRLLRFNWVSSYDTIRLTADLMFELPQEKQPRVQRSFQLTPWKRGMNDSDPYTLWPFSSGWLSGCVISPCT